MMMRRVLVLAVLLGMVGCMDQDLPLDDESVDSIDEAIEGETVQSPAPDEPADLGRNACMGGCNGRYSDDRHLCHSGVYGDRDSWMHAWCDEAAFTSYDRCTIDCYHTTVDGT